MLTPFDSTYAQKCVNDMLDTSRLKTDTAEYLNDIIFKSALPWEDDDLPDGGSAEPLELEICYEVWTGACMLDIILNSTDYSRDCTGYAESVSQAAELLKESLYRTKRRLFKSVPVHDVREIIQNAIDSLDYLLMADAEDSNGDIQTSELGEEMKRAGKSEELERSVIELQNRLGEHIEYE